MQKTLTLQIPENARVAIFIMPPVKAWPREKETFDADYEVVDEDAEVA